MAGNNYSSEFISIKLEGLEQLKGLLELTNPALYAKALKGGVATAARSVPKAAAKAIGQRYNLKASRIKQDIQGPYIKADGAYLLFASRPPTLNQFGFKPGTRATGQPGLGRGMGWGKATSPGTGGSAMIFKGQRITYPSTFLATSKSGQELPFRRGRGYSSTGRRRLVVNYGPSIASIYRGGKFGPAIRAEVEQEINTRFIVGYQRVLDSAARGYGKQ